MKDEGERGVGAKRIDRVDATRAKLLRAARAAFAEKGYAAASMDDLTAEAGLTRGALYHHFGDKRGLLQAVVGQIDSEMAARAHAAIRPSGDEWEDLLAEGCAYIEMALEPEVQRIVLLDGPAALGDPSRWPSQDSCLQATTRTVERLIAAGTMKPVDPEAAARLLNGAALNAALWIAASDAPHAIRGKAVAAFRALAGGLLAQPRPTPAPPAR